MSLSKNKYLTQFLREYLKLIIQVYAPPIEKFFFNNKYAGMKRYFDKMQFNQYGLLSELDDLVESQYQQSTKNKPPQDYLHNLGLNSEPCMHISGKGLGISIMIDAQSSFKFNEQLNQLEEISHSCRLYNEDDNYINQILITESLLLTDTLAVNDWLNQLDAFTHDFIGKCVQTLESDIDFFFFEFYRTIQDYYPDDLKMTFTRKVERPRKG